MRYPSIDMLRMLAIFVMVLVHFPENLSGYIPPFTGLGAPLFAILSGVSYRLWVSGQQARGKSELEISKVSVRRGLFVFGAGFTFNILVWLPEDTFNWDVLTFIGFGLLTLNLMRRIPLTISVLVAVIAIIISPILRSLADYHAYWINGYYEGDLTLTDLFIGFTTTGYFPLFPWIAYSLTGFVMASLMFAESSEEQENVISPWKTVACGALLLVAAFVALGSRPYLPAAVSKHVLAGWTMFPPTIEYVLATMGMSLVLFGLAHRFVDHNPRALKYKGLLDIAKTFSRYSLTIYVLHHLVHLWPLWIYGHIMQDDPTHYWRIAMPVSISVPLAILFLAICYFIFHRIGPNERHGLEAWMRWLCD